MKTKNQKAKKWAVKGKNAWGGIFSDHTIKAKTREQAVAEFQRRYGQKPYRATEAK